MLAALGSIACANPTGSEGCSLRGFAGRSGVESTVVEGFKAPNSLATEAAARCTRLEVWKLSVILFGQLKQNRRREVDI